LELVEGHAPPVVTVRRAAGYRRCCGTGQLRGRRVIADAGEQATRRFLEVFAAAIRDRNNLAAYMIAASRFNFG
jgi:hypothetical protein